MKDKLINELDWLYSLFNTPGYMNMPEEQKEAAKQVIANSIEYIKFLNDNINPELS